MPFLLPVSALQINDYVCLDLGRALDKDHSHGWLGNPTDKLPYEREIANPSFLSVGLPSHPWDLILFGSGRRPGWVVRSGVSGHVQTA